MNYKNPLMPVNKLDSDMTSLTYQSKHTDIDAALHFRDGKPVPYTPGSQIRVLKFVQPVHFCTCLLNTSDSVKRAKLDETWSYLDKQVKLAYLSSFAVWFPGSQATAAAFWRPMAPLPKDVGSRRIYRFNGIKFTPTSAQVDWELIGEKQAVPQDCVLTAPEPEEEVDETAAAEDKLYDQ